MSEKKNSFKHSQPQLREMAQEILDYARSRGATACETDVSEGCGQTVSVRCGEVETLEYNRDKGVGVTVYLGQQRGHASSSDFSREALRSTVDAALSIARYTAPDPAAGLADPDRLWRGPELDLKLHHPWALEAEAAVELAKRCERAAFEQSPEIRNSEGAGIYRQESQFVSANSNGFCHGFSTSRHSISCSVIAGQGEGMQRDDWHVSRRDPLELPEPEEIGRLAASRALARLGSRRAPTSEVPVIFEAPLVAGLIGTFVQAASGGSLYRKSSFLLDALDKPVFSPNVNLVEDPHIPKALGSTPYDDEGVSTQKRVIVEDGILRGYFLGSYSARKLGMQSTGNAGGSHNLLLRSGKESLEALIAGMGRGLLVTELLGQGVNYVTGDYSRGAAGFWVENGRIAFPVHEITIAGNLKDMFRNIVAIGNDVLIRGGKQCPSIMIGKMMVAGE